MEPALINGLIAARVAQMQMAIAAKMLRMNADAAQSVVQLLDAADANMRTLTAAVSDLGKNLDISV